MDGVVADDGERLGVELFLEDDGAENRIDVAGRAFALQRTARAELFGAVLHAEAADEREAFLLFRADAHDGVFLAVGGVDGGLRHAGGNAFVVLFIARAVGVGGAEIRPCVGMRGANHHVGFKNASGVMNDFADALADFCRHRDEIAGDEGDAFIAASRHNRLGAKGMDDSRGDAFVEVARQAGADGRRDVALRNTDFQCLDFISHVHFSLLLKCCICFREKESIVYHALASFEKSSLATFSIAFFRESFFWASTLKTLMSCSSSSKSESCLFIRSS